MLLRLIIAALVLGAVFSAGCRSDGGALGEKSEHIDIHDSIDPRGADDVDSAGTGGAAYYDWYGDPCSTAWYRYGPSSSLEAWATHPDALVIGTVVDITPYTHPFVGTGVPGSGYTFGRTDEDVCPKTRFHGARITLGDVETLHGDPQQGEVVVHLGAGVLAKFLRIVRTDPETGEFAGWGGWMLTQRDEDLEMIQLGELMGINLMCDDYWGFCGNWGWPMFRLDESGRVVFIPSSPDVGYSLRVCDPRPEGVEGLTLPELREALAGMELPADDDPDLVRLRHYDPRYRSNWDEDRARTSRLVDYWGARCDMDPDRPRGGCHESPVIDGNQCWEEHMVCQDGGLWHGVCVEPCRSGDDCGPDWVCAPEGVCTRPCNEDGTCPMGPVPGSICVESFCRPDADR